MGHRLCWGFITQVCKSTAARRNCRRSYSARLVEAWQRRRLGDLDKRRRIRHLRAEDLEIWKPALFLARGLINAEEEDFQKMSLCMLVVFTILDEQRLATIENFQARLKVMCDIAGSQLPQVIQRRERKWAIFTWTLLRQSANTCQYDF